MTPPSPGRRRRALRAIACGIGRRWAGAALLGSVAVAQPLALPLDLPLPTVVAADAAAAAAQARAQPELVAESERAQRSLARAEMPPRPEVSLDPALRLGWDGTTGVDVAVAARLPLVDPSAERTLLDARTWTDRLALEAAIRARRAALETVENHLQATRIAEQIAVVRAARALPLPRGADARRRLARLRAAEADLSFERARISRLLRRATGREPPDAVPTDAWTSAGSGTEAEPDACPYGADDVLLARASLAEAVDRARAARASIPSVTAGVAADLRVAEFGAAGAEYGARVWLEIGMPRDAGVAGRLRLEGDGSGLRLQAHLRSDRDPGTVDRDATAAEAGLASARFRAHEYVLRVRHELAQTERRLASLAGPAAGPAGIDALEARFERAELAAYAASLRVRLAFDCAGARRGDQDGAAARARGR